jgi:hypothetical protein
MLTGFGLMASVFLLGAAFAEDKNHLGQVTAAWVQAIGSIAAVAGAAWISGDQSRREDARRTSQRRADAREKRAEAAQGLSMLIMVATNASATAKALAADIRAGRVNPSSAVRVYHPVFADFRLDLDGLIATQAGGLMINAFAVRGLVTHVMFVLRGTATANELGELADTAGYLRVAGLLAEAGAAIDEHIAGASTTRDELSSDEPPAWIWQHKG